MINLGYETVSWNKGAKVKGVKSVLVDLSIGSSAIVDAIEKTQKILGENFKLDVLVNNAGVCQAKKFEEISEEDYDRIMDTNLKAMFFTSSFLLSWMKKGDNKNIASNIINISSISGLQGFTGHTHYCASKFGVIGLTQSMAKELSTQGIAVNAVCPGPTQTPMWEALDKEYSAMNGWTGLETGEQKYFGKLLIKRIGDPSDVADAVEYLIKSKYSTGTALTVCGGNILR